MSRLSSRRYDRSQPATDAANDQAVGNRSPARRDPVAEMAASEVEAGLVVVGANVNDDADR